MISYKLAKQLKEAGFPKENFVVHYPNAKYPNRKGQSGTPTLSELIEACGEKFLCLGKETDEAEYRKWLAISTIPKEDKRPIMSTSIWDYYVGCLQNMERENGQTPEEAVAKLWLKLNEH